MDKSNNNKKVKSSKEQINMLNNSEKMELFSKLIGLMASIACMENLIVIGLSLYLKKFMPERNEQLYKANVMLSFLLLILFLGLLTNKFKVLYWDFLCNHKRISDVLDFTSLIGILVQIFNNFVFNKDEHFYYLLSFILIFVFIILIFAMIIICEEESNRTNSLIQESTYEKAYELKNILTGYLKWEDNSIKAKTLRRNEWKNLINFALGNRYSELKDEKSKKEIENLLGKIKGNSMEDLIENYRDYEFQSEEEAAKYIEDTVEKLKLILQSEYTNTVKELKTTRSSRNKNSLNGIRFDFRFGIHFRK